MDGTREAGPHSVTWIAGSARPGVYFVRADLGSGPVTKKLVRLR